MDRLGAVAHRQERENALAQQHQLVAERALEEGRGRDGGESGEAARGMLGVGPQSRLDVRRQWRRFHSGGRERRADGEAELAVRMLDVRAETVHHRLRRGVPHPAREAHGRRGNRHRRGGERVRHAGQDGIAEPAERGDGGPARRGILERGDDLLDVSGVARAHGGQRRRRARPAPDRGAER